MPVDPLELTLKVVDDDALRRLLAFGDQARQVVNGIAQAQEQRNRQVESVLRQLLEARFKSIQDGYRNDEKAAQATADKTLGIARQNQAAFIKLSSELREARIRGIQDAAAAEEKAQQDALGGAMRQQQAFIALSNELREARIKGVQDAAKADEKEQQEMVADAQRRQQAYVALSSELKEARIKGVQDAAKADEKEQERLIGEALKKQRAYIALSSELKDAKIRGAQVAGQADEKEQEKLIEDALRRQRAYIALSTELKEARIKGAQEAAAGEIGGARRTEGAIMNVARAYTTLRIAAEAAHAFRAVWQTVARSIAEARDNLNKFTDATEKAQDASTELAAILGVKNAPQFQVQQAREAASVGMRTGEWRDFQRTFFDVGGGRIIPAGENQAMGAGEMAKAGYSTNIATATEFEKRVARYNATTRGLPQEQAASLAASVVQTAPAGATADQMFAQYIRQSAIATRTRGRTGQVVGMLADIGAEYARNEEGGKGDWERSLKFAALGSVLAERNVPEMESSVRSLDMWARDVRKRAAEERRKTGRSRMQDLGLTPEMMDDPQKLIAQLNLKQKQFLAAGHTEQEWEDKFGGNYRFALRNFSVASRSGNVMEARLREANAADAGAADRQARDALGDITNPGFRHAQEAAIEGAQYQKGAVNVYLRARERAAIARLIARGDLTNADNAIEAGRLQGREALGFGTKEQQLIREEVNAEMDREFRQLYRQGDVRARRFANENARPLFGFIPNGNPYNTGSGVFDTTTPENVRSEAADLLAKIHAESEKQTRLLEDMRRQQGAPQGQPNAPPALPAGRPPQQVNAGRP